MTKSITNQFRNCKDLIISIKLFNVRAICYRNREIMILIVKSSRANYQLNNITNKEINYKSRRRQIY